MLRAKFDIHDWPSLSRARRGRSIGNYTFLIHTGMANSKAGLAISQQINTMFPRIPFDRVNWLVSSFLIGTLLLSVTAVPLYLWFFGIDWFQIVLFFAMFGACGFSISLGYHRLFSHLTFQAHWSVRLFTVIFGAGAFENSVLLWSCEHRSHHKHVDHDDDPYCITKGLFYAHMGWLMFKLKPLPPFDNVADLKKDPLVAWQDRYIHLIAALVAFVLPASLGFLWGGWKAALGAFLIGRQLHRGCLSWPARNRSTMDTAQGRTARSDSRNAR
jgi:stearoyl-CoA desaturase (Delta-9 desaturase)